MKVWDVQNFVGDENQAFFRMKIIRFWVLACIFEIFKTFFFGSKKMFFWDVQNIFWGFSACFGMKIWVIAFIFGGNLRIFRWKFTFFQTFIFG